MLEKQYDRIGKFLIISLEKYDVLNVRSSTRSHSWLKAVHHDRYI